jgi:pimeloyl-ACP methyl ester carboxylesterase
LGSFLGAEEVHYTWESGFTPICADVERYQSFPFNQKAHARWLKGPGANRPVIVAIHGYSGGSFRFEARIFPTKRWLDQGYDVMMIALPFHGPRRAPGDRLRFPSGRPDVTIDGFRQAVWDLRALVSWLLSQGVPWVALAGMSLGGYVGALTATVEDRLAFVLSYIPLASLADFYRSTGRVQGDPEEYEQRYLAVDAMFSSVSPLKRPSVVPASRHLVVSGEGDRITPIDHGERLSQHLGCELVRLQGGHVLQWDRAAAWGVFEQSHRSIETE